MANRASGKSFLTQRARICDVLCLYISFPSLVRNVINSMTASSVRGLFISTGIPFTLTARILLGDFPPTSLRISQTVIPVL